MIHLIPDLKALVISPSGLKFFFMMKSMIPQKHISMFSLKIYQIHEQTSKSGVPVMGCGRGRVAGGLQTLLDRETKSKK